MKRAPLAACGLSLLLASACGPAEPSAVPTTATGSSSQPSARSGTADPARSLAQAGDTSPGWFRDVTAASGLDFVHDAGVTDERQLPETMGAGAALVDLDGSGSLDVYLVQSGALLLPGRTPPSDPPLNALFLNDGRGVFRDHTAASGDAAHDGYGMGVAAGDVNGDGHIDLFVTNVGPDVLLANDGRAVFQDVTAGTDLADERWTGSAAFFDADVDGDLDLYVAAYVDIDLAHPAWCGRREDGWRSYCHPDAFAGLADRFYLNDGAGRFHEATKAAGLQTRTGHHGKGLGVLTTDFDDDGLVDLYVANDSVENRMWLNVGGGRFVDGTLLSATGVNGRGLTEAGMGVAAGDLDGDADSDLFVTNFDDESNTLYRNDGDGLFSDITSRAGLDAPSRLPVGFGTVLTDFDADGDLDIAVANGHIIDNIALYHDGKTHAQHALLFTNDGHARFRDVSVHAGDLTARPFVGRGLYAGDLDGDGAVDLLLTRCGGRALFLRNDGPPGEPRNSSVIIAGLPADALVEAERSDGLWLVRRAGPQPSYFGQTSGRVHLGLGQQALVSIRIRLPQGAAWSHSFAPPFKPAARNAAGSDPALATARSEGMLIWSESGELQIPGRGGTMMDRAPIDPASPSPPHSTQQPGTNR